MPVAGGSIATQVKYHYEDHDTDTVSEAPPVQNTWYTAFEAEDVRLLLCRVKQTNTEAANKICEVRWTIDGNVYLISLGLVDGETWAVWRNHFPSPGGLTGGEQTASPNNACINVDKRGLSFKVEVRMTAAPGTAQTLECWCVRETLEET